MVSLRAGTGEMGLVSYDLGAGRAGDERPALRALVDVDFPCNLGCAGCTRRRAPAPDRATLDALAERLVAAIDGTDAGRVLPVFFGGEPLLDADGVARASTRVRAACARRGVAYEACAITNGTLLDDRAAVVLAAAGISRVQVTLAGTAAVHDWRRPLAGAGSFHRIVRNIRAVRQRLSVVVRCDVGEGCGLGSVADLVRVLEEEGFFDEPNPAMVLLGRPASYASQARALLSFGSPARVLPFTHREPDPVTPAG
jgi:sulfatase maturation enzyme AslB (radical SAM superfamily)